MGERLDVIVVGARCAGAPLATLLARQGLRVAVVERATFPRDTLSTHIVEAPAINFLRRLGVMDDVRATGASPVSRIDAFRQAEALARAIVRASKDRMRNSTPPSPSGRGGATTTPASTTGWPPTSARPGPCPSSCAR